MQNNIAIYFYGGMAEIYQLNQWMDVFNLLSHSVKLKIVVRNKKVYNTLICNIDLDIVYVDTINDLLSYYEKIDFKVIIYVNNGFKNFQSLIFHRAMHVHINHGESEKSSMHSNQSKAYDYVFVSSNIAFERYKSHLLNFEENKYLKIGRPQLDFIDNYNIDTTKKVILYAPTDESTHISMRYTSLERLGLEIVEKILSNNEYFLIYRPHPSTGKNSKIVKDINDKIINKIVNSKNAIVDTKTNILNIFSKVDIAIFDNSSLIIDFLYYDKPIFMTNMFLKEYHNIDNLKVLDVAILIDEKNIDNLISNIKLEDQNDSLKEIRNLIKIDYLGNYQKGESTKLFISTIIKISEQRDKLLIENNMMNTLH